MLTKFKRLNLLLTLDAAEPMSENPSHPAGSMRCFSTLSALFFMRCVTFCSNKCQRAIFPAHAEHEPAKPAPDAYISHNEAGGLDRLLHRVADMVHTAALGTLTD